MDYEEFKEAVQIRLDRLNVLLPLAAGYRVELFRSSAWVYSRQFDKDDDVFVDLDWGLRDALEPVGITLEEWNALGFPVSTGDEWREATEPIEAKLIAYLTTKLEKE